MGIGYGDQAMIDHYVKIRKVEKLTVPYLEITRGLPGSGKTTSTRGRLVIGKTIGVNRDYLRMMTGGKWFPADEDLVTEIHTAAIRIAITRGLNVIVDDTFLQDRWVDKMRALAVELGAEFVVNDEFLKVPLEVCIERDSLRERKVGREVIERMYRDHKYLFHE